MDFFYEDFVRNYQIERQDYDYRTTLENNNNDTTYATLKNFYYLTNGPNWTTQCWSGQEGSCWMTANTSYCNWYGIMCDKESNVIWLAMESNNMFGSFPSDFNLPFLQLLDLKGNTLVGSLPTSLCNITSITSIKLNSNNFTGTIPDCYGNITNLDWLDLRDNNLIGNIPISLGNLINLGTLRLNNNQLIGTIPLSFGNFTKLTELDLSNNQLTGVIPDIFANLQILYLTLGANQLEGNLPESLFSMTNMQKLVVTSNRLSGPLSPNVQNLVNLRMLVIDNNQFTGNIPEEIYSLTNICAIDLAYNNFTGEISPKIQQTALTGSLFYFSILGNQMKSVGDLPNWLVESPIYTQLNEGLIYYCFPLIISTSPAVQLQISPSYDNYQNCFCANNYYGTPPNNCKPCPDNCNCTLGGGSLTWPAGYYPIFSQDSPIDPDQSNLGSEIEDDISFYFNVLYSLPCPDSKSCNPNGNCSLSSWFGIDEDCTLCQEGSYGRLCSRCLCRNTSYCYFQNGYKCEFCQNFTSVKLLGPVIFTAIVLIFIVFVSIYIYYQGKSNDWQMYYSTMITADSTSFSYKSKKIFEEVFLRRKSGQFKILLVYIQIVNVLFINLWNNETILSSMKYLDIFNVRLYELGVVCLFPWMNDPFIHLIFDNALPLGVAGLIILLIILMKIVFIFKKKSPVDDFNRKRKKAAQAHYYGVHLGIYLLSIFFYILYFHLCISNMMSLNCIEEQDTSIEYVQNNPWLRCDTAEWNKIRNLSIAGIVIYVIGIPIIFALMLRKLNKRAKGSVVKIWIGPLYHCYKPNFYWMETIIFIRRLALAAFIVLVPAKSPVQVCGIVGILLISLVIQFYLKPYTTLKDNFLEELSIGTICISYIFLVSRSFGIVFGIWSDLMAGAALLMNVLAFFLMCFIMIKDIEKVKVKQYEEDGSLF